MFENIYEIYDPEYVIFRRAKKKTYEDRMSEFRSTYGNYINDMLSGLATIEDAEEKAALAKENGEQIASVMFEHFAKKGKIGTAKRADLTLFMIYYVFPALLLTGDENSTVAADGLLEAWSVKFKCPGMGYTTYEELLSSFREKIFGLF